MRGFASYCLTTITGSVAKISCQLTSISVIAGVQMRSSLSRRRKRTPLSTPWASVGAGTSGGWTKIATSRNDTRYVAASM